jgi:hypothetical protein
LKMLAIFARRMRARRLLADFWNYVEKGQYKNENFD